MSSSAKTSQIFICYGHKDNESSDPNQRWLDRLNEHLEPLQLTDKAEIWSDQRIEMGDDWNGKIQAALGQVSVAVLLVSPSFLASKYIRNSELPVLLYKAKTQGVIILPVILRQCMWKETTFKYPDPQSGPEELSLATIQVPTTKPLNSLSQHEQDEVLYQVAQRINQIIKTPTIKSEPLQPQQQSNSSSTASFTTNNLSPTERLNLMQTLNAIMPEQLDVIIFTLTPPPGIIPPLPASQGQRVAALLSWSQSPTGCGLKQLQQILAQIVPAVASGVTQPNNPLSTTDNEIVALWREKLSSYQREEAIASDPEKKFQLEKLIEECQKKIKELGG